MLGNRRGFCKHFTPVYVDKCMHCGRQCKIPYGGWCMLVLYTYMHICTSQANTTPPPLHTHTQYVHGKLYTLFVFIFILSPMTPMTISEQVVTHSSYPTKLWNISTSVFTVYNIQWKLFETIFKGIT